MTKGAPPSRGDESLQNLMASARLAPLTKENYRIKIEAYLSQVGMSPDQLLEQANDHPKQFEKQFAAFLQELMPKVTASTIAGYRDAIKKLLEVNRANKKLDWGYINEYVPRHKKSGEDRSPTLDEVHKIVERADLRTKCLILFLCSSGARIGSVGWLKWRDLEEVEVSGKKFARVTIYRGESEEYTTFVTPECYAYFLDYRKMRAGLGENVIPQSFVFVTEPNKREPDPTKVRQVSVRTLKNQLGELLKIMDIRTKLDTKTEYRKYDFKQAHGFRKFFKTRMEVGGVKPIITELLMGHDLGVSNSYMKPSADELAKEYANAIPALTILQQEKVGNVKDELRRQLLLVAGFKEEEISKLDLSKTPDEEFQKMVREKLLGVMANNGNRQKVVPLGEVRELIPQGGSTLASFRLARP